MITHAASPQTLISASELEALESQTRFLSTGNGHRLSFHEYGDPTGRPVLFFHGTGSHVHGMLLHKPACELGFRIIAPDRPGIGQSSFRPGWTLLDYADAMDELCTSLGLATVDAIGVSGGGPTLMAMAYRYPERLSQILALACVMPVMNDPRYAEGVGRSVRIIATLGRTLPLPLFRLPYAALGALQTLFRSPRSFARLFASSLSEGDRALFRQPNYQHLFMRDFQETFRQGSKGPAYDVQTFHKPWGFDLSGIPGEILCHHGTEDRIVPLSHSEYLQQTARHVRLVRRPGLGHLELLADGHAVLAALVND